MSRKNEKNHSNLIYSRNFLRMQKEDAAVPGCTRHSKNYCFRQLPQALILQKGCDQMPNICGTAATLGGA